MSVYLLHFERSLPEVKSYGRTLRDCQHYTGWTASGLVGRLVAHRAGNGSRLTKEFQRAGIPFRLARVWPGETKEFEELVRRDEVGFCPICRVEGADLGAGDGRVDRLRVRASRLRVRLVQDQKVGSPTFGLWNIVPSHEFERESAMTLDEVETELEVREGAKRRSGGDLSL